MGLCTLRQGTVLIAVVDMLLSGIFLFLLLLGSAHAHEMSDMLDADMMDPGRREETIRSRMNNESRMQNAQHLASATIVTMYTVICVVTVHLISGVSLLCGAVLRKRQFLVPWASVVMVELLLGGTLLMSAAWVGEGSRAAYVIGAITIQLYMCLWGVVWHYYRRLCRETCAEEHVTEHPVVEYNTKDTFTTIKSDYISFPHDKPQHV